jgi:hypothetical protein
VFKVIFVNGMDRLIPKWNPLNTAMPCYRNRQSVFLLARLSRAMQDRLPYTVRNVALARMGFFGLQRSTSMDAFWHACYAEHIKNEIRPRLLVYEGLSRAWRSARVMSRDVVPALCRSIDPCMNAGRRGVGRSRSLGPLVTAWWTDSTPTSL